MKTTTSRLTSQVIEKANKISTLPSERVLIKVLLERGFVRTLDRTEKMMKICNELGLSVMMGNDAPRGGKVGNYIKNFDDELLNKISTIQKRKHSIEKARFKRKEQETILRRDIQENNLIEYYRSNPDFLKKIKNRIETSSSKVWRNWVRLKVCAVVCENFAEFELSAPNIREITYSL